MFLPLLLYSLSTITLSTQLSISQRSCQGNINTTPIANSSELIGKWYLTYLWYDLHFEIDEPDCFEVPVVAATEEDKAAYEVKCGAPPPGEIQLKLPMTIEIPVGDRYIARRGNEWYVLQTCDETTRMEPRRAGENILVISPGLAMTEMLSPVVKSLAELECLAESVDVMKGKQGQPFCWLE